MEQVSEEADQNPGTGTMTKKRTRSQIGRLSRNKGKTFERRVANDLKPIFGDQVKRGLAQSRFGIGEAPDVDGCPGLWIETKHGKLVSLRAALQQAEDAMAIAKRPGDRWPIAVCKDDRQQPLVLMRWEHYLQLLEEWWQRGNPTPSQDNQAPTTQEAPPDPPSSTDET